MEEGCSEEPGSFTPQLDISVILVFSYVNITFSIFLATRHGGSQFRVIRGESFEAIHLYILIPSTLVIPQETLDKYLSLN